MDKNKIFNFKEKSLHQRFLFIIGILFFLIYLTLGGFIIFWESFPINLRPGFRIAFGVLLIIYSFIRFVRLLNTTAQTE